MPRPDRLSFILVTSAVMCVVLHGYVDLGTDSSFLVVNLSHKTWFRSKSGLSLSELLPRISNADSKTLRWVTA